MLKVLMKLCLNFVVLLLRDYGGVIYIYSGSALPRGAFVLVLVLLLDPKRITFFFICMSGSVRFYFNS